MSCASVHWLTADPSPQLQVLLSFVPTHEDPPISIIARLPPSVLPELVPSDLEPISIQANGRSEDPRTIVAIRQGRHFLTTFHPELTLDDRFHDFFVRECVLPQMVK